MTALTHISLVSFLWDIGKQSKPRSDVAKHDVWRDVWSGFPLFAYRMILQNLSKSEKYHPTTFKTEMDRSNYLDWKFHLA